LASYLDGAPDLLALPTDYPRRADRSRVSDYISVEINVKTARGLEELAQRHGTTLFSVLIGAYGYLLGTSEPDKTTLSSVFRLLVEV